MSKAIMFPSNQNEGWRFIPEGGITFGFTTPKSSDPLEPRLNLFINNDGFSVSTYLPKEDIFTVYLSVIAEEFDRSPLVKFATIEKELAEVKAKLAEAEKKIAGLTTASLDKLVLEMKKFENGLTVSELKEIVNSWSDFDVATGEPCEVWIGDGGGLTNQVFRTDPLNVRHEDGSEWLSADLLLGLSNKVNFNRT